MHAVVFQVDIQEWEGNADRELEQLVTMMKSVPGFVRGTWTTDGRRGLSFIVFETEQAALGVADNAAVPPGASISLRSVDVYESYATSDRGEAVPTADYDISRQPCVNQMSWTSSRIPRRSRSHSWSRSGLLNRAAPR